MKELSYPITKGGRVTDCNFDPDGTIKDIWIVLDAGVTTVEFVSEFNILYTGTVHVSTEKKASE
jgi:hypothetical protein